MATTQSTINTTSVDMRQVSTQSKINTTSVDNCKAQLERLNQMNQDNLKNSNYSSNYFVNYLRISILINIIMFIIIIWLIFKSLGSDEKDDEK